MGGIGGATSSTRVDADGNVVTLTGVLARLVPGSCASENFAFRDALVYGDVAKKKVHAVPGGKVQKSPGGCREGYSLNPSSEKGFQRQNMRFMKNENQKRMRAIGEWEKMKDKSKGDLHVIMFLPSELFSSYAYETDFLPRARKMLSWLQEDPADHNPYWRHMHGGNGLFVRVIDNIEQLRLPATESILEELVYWCFEYMMIFCQLSRTPLTHVRPCEYVYASVESGKNAFEILGTDKRVASKR